MMTRSLFFGICLGLAACGGGKKTDTTTTTQPSADKSLYERLGGIDAIKLVVKDFVNEQVAKDDRINKKFFNNVDLPKLEEHLVNQICEATGGPCKYAGKDMKAAHAGMGISSADFDALVEDLVKSLNKFKVAAADQKALLGILGPMKAQIVEKK